MRHFVSVAALLFTLSMTASAEAATDTVDTGLAWKNYLKNETGVRPSLQFPHASCFRAAALAHQLPETLLLAVARGESDFDAYARSKANAHGVMQIQWPGTARHLGLFRLTELYEPCTNIDAGARYLKELLTKYNGDLHLALAAYNYGPSRISASGDDVPPGAEWYSGYIYRHLGYVIGSRDNRDTRSSMAETLYSDLGRTTLVSFGEPYRAAAFVAGLEQRAPNLQLDWFRKGVGKFVVVLIYSDKDEFRSGAEMLSSVGFPLS